MFNMESPAHEFSTGIPMSTKGTLDHLNTISVGVKTSESDGEAIDTFYDSKSAVSALLNNLSRDNSDCFISSIQDGEELFYNIVCGSELHGGGSLSSSLLKSSEDEMVSNSKYEKSVTTVLCRETSLSSAADVVAHDVDEPLEGMPLSVPDFKFPGKNTVSLNHCMEEQKKLNESISAIAKSLGIEDFLPEIFQDESQKDSSTSGIVGSCENQMSDMCNLEKESMGLDIPEAPVWPGEDSLDLSCAPMTPKSVTKDRDLTDDGMKYITCSKDSMIGGNCYIDVVPAAKEADSSSELSSHLKEPHTEGFEILDKMVECILESNSCDDTVLPMSSNDHEVADSSVEVPMVHISETECESDGADNNGINNVKNKVLQIIVTTSEGDQILELDSEIATTLNLMTSVNEQSVSDGFCPDEILNEICDSNSVHKNSCGLKELTCDKNLMAIVTKRGKRRKFPCTVKGCGKVMDRECQMKVHMMTHKGERPFKCNIDGCSWAFTTPYRLRRHCETHIGKKDYICDFQNCNRRFTTIYNLNTHKKRHKWPNALKCPAVNCDMSFTNRRKLELHLKIHEEVEAPYKCWICQKKYYSANCIASHNRTHRHTEDDFKCPFPNCGKKYDKICRLKQHIRLHTGERPYVCPAEGCTWSFVSASKLTRHMRKHTGERKFVCTEPGCGKSFMRPEHLKGHVVIHTGAKPFQCPHENCKSRFTAKSSLYVHMKKHNSERKVVYSCPVITCIKEYNNKTSLKQHVLKAHGNILDVDQPDILKVARSVVDSSIECDPEATVPKRDIPKKVITRIRSKIVSPKEICNKVNPQSRPPKAPIISNVCSIQSATSNTQSKPDQNKRQESSIILKHNDPSNSSITPYTVSEIKLTSGKLRQENRSGSARTDYCCTYLHNKKLSSQNRVRFGLLNNNSEDSKSKETDVSSQNQCTMDSTHLDDALLASSIVFFQDPSDQIGHEQFLLEDASGGVIFQDPVLLNNQVLALELPMTSFMCDGFDNGGSVTPSVSATNFTEHGSDEFAENMSFQELEEKPLICSFLV